MAQDQRQEIALGDIETSPVRLQRLAHKAVNNLGLSLVDVAVEPREGDQVAIVLPQAWAYLFLAHLEATAKQVQEQLRRAMWQAKLKDGRMQEQLDAARREWEARQVKIQERYRQLVAEGLPFREAIRRIRKESHREYTATEIASIVTAADPRKKRARRDQNARIWEKAKTMTRKQIAAEEGLTVKQVGARLKWERRKRDAKAVSGATD